MKDHLFCAIGQLKHKLHKAWSRKKEWIPKQQQYRQFPGLIDHIKQKWWFKERLSPQLSSEEACLLACSLAYSRSPKNVLLPSSIFVFPQDQEQVKNIIITRCAKYAPAQEVLVFPKDQEQARTSDSASIATTRWTQSQKDMNLTKTKLDESLLTQQKNKQIAAPPTKSCKASRVQISNLAANLPTLSKNPKPTFQSTYLSISILVFIHYWGKEFFLEKVLVLLARLAHLLEVSTKPSLLWIVDPINLLFWSCELEIMILNFFSFSFFLSCEIELIIFKNELAFFSFEVVT